MFAGNVLGASIRPNKSVQHNPDWQSACNATPPVLQPLRMRFFCDTPVRYILPLCTVTFRMDTTLIPTESQISLHLLYQHDSIGLTLRCLPDLPVANRFTAIRVIRLWRGKDDFIELHDCAPAVLSGRLAFCVGVMIQTLIGIRICRWSGYSGGFKEKEREGEGEKLLIYRQSRKHSGLRDT